MEPKAEGTCWKKEQKEPGANYTKDKGYKKQNVPEAKVIKGNFQLDLNFKRSSPIVWQTRKLIYLCEYVSKRVCIHLHMNCVQEKETVL